MTPRLEIKLEFRDQISKIKKARTLTLPNSFSVIQWPHQEILDLDHTKRKKNLMLTLKQSPILFPNYSHSGRFLNLIQINLYLLHQNH